MEPILTYRNNEDLSIFSEDDLKKTELYVDSTSKRDSTTSVPSSERTNAQSTASVTTLVSNANGFTPKGINSGEGVTSGLLINGSRAVGAVVRPYPTATVGTPSRIDFDIASTSFKYTVKVAATDKVPNGVKTEIYLPFVHYAASLDPYMVSTTSSPSASKVSLNSKSGASKDSSATAPLRLAIDVKASAGSYEVKGQTLFWTYPIPATGEMTYTIEVKRQGGAIKKDLGYVQSGGWAEVCPSCVIA